MRVGTPEFNGQRLKEAREARGLTCQALADSLGVSRSSVSNYENSIQTPSPDALRQLSAALRMPSHFFTRDIPPKETAAKFFRSFHSATKRSRLMAARKFEWFREITAFVHQFVKFPDLNIPAFGIGRDYDLLSAEDIEHLASDLRAHWKLGDRPISNVVWLIENNGIMCCRFLFESTLLDGFSEWRGMRPFVALSSDKDCCVRSRYDAAHELAHLILHRSLASEPTVNCNRFSLIEQQADAFASAFLLPASTFADDFSPSLDALRERKRKWHASIGSMIKRGRQLDLISETQEKHLWRQMGRRKWRTREPLDNVLPPEQPEYIRRSIALLEKRGLSSVRDIAFQLALHEQDVVDLCGVSSILEVELLASEAGDDRAESNDPRAILRFPAQQHS